MAIKLALVGIGKIARDQHLPVLRESSDFDLVAAASRNASVDGVRNFTTLAELLDAVPEVEAVSLCTPPVGRAADARRALERGVHVMLEKPPGATLSEAHDLIDLAAHEGMSLFVTWHSRHAAAVPAARDWLRGRQVRRVHVRWMEDIRVWHPGQDWILAPGGLGVFDPGINALSIVTAILPEAFALEQASLTFPENRQAPIAAELRFRDHSGAPVEADFDFLHQGVQRWDIEVETDGGKLTLRDGGARMFIDDAPRASDREAPLHGEYEALYRRFAELIRTRSSETDLTPLRHVADAFMLGERKTGPSFHF